MPCLPPPLALALSLSWLVSPLLTCPTSRALTRPQVHGDLLWRHLNDVGARVAGALAAERQAPQNLGDAGRALQLPFAAVSDQVCLQVTPGGDRPQAAEVLGKETGGEREVVRCLSRTPQAEGPSPAG